MEIMIRILGPLVAIAGFILLYHGFHIIKKMIFPDYYQEFSVLSRETLVDFEKAGKYEILFSSSFSPLRKISKAKKMKIHIYESLSKQESVFIPYQFSLWSRSNERGEKFFPFGYFEVKKSGTYLITCISSDVEGNTGLFSIMSYSGGIVQLFLMIWSLILGVFLALGGSIL